MRVRRGVHAGGKRGERGETEGRQREDGWERREGTEMDREVLISWGKVDEKY